MASHKRHTSHTRYHLAQAKPADAQRQIAYPSTGPSVFGRHPSPGATCFANDSKMCRQYSTPNWFGNDHESKRLVVRCDDFQFRETRAVDSLDGSSEFDVEQHNVRRVEWHETSRKSQVCINYKSAAHRWIKLVFESE